jgi:HEAT repeat protein
MRAAILPRFAPRERNPVTEIKIREPDASPAGSQPSPESPYKNLLVPLVVVPALIVMVIVVVFVLFGAIAGHESSPRENLDKVLHGGKNERQQAAFALVRQVLENRQAQGAGRAPEWDIDPSFLPELRAALEQTDELESPGDVPTPLVLASLLAQLGDAGGVTRLGELTALSARLDPGGEYRFHAASALGAIGPELEAAERESAANVLIGLLESPDPGLVLVAVAGLQNLPGPRTVPALEGMLGSRVLEQRATAALSLATLGEASAAPVLLEMLALEPYEAERELDPHKWPPRRVSESRRKALAALARLACPPERAVLERLAGEDPDPLVRDAARSLLVACPGG